MRVRFLNLTIENFCRIREEQSVPFEKIGNGLHYVRGINDVNKRLGSNGASKSTIWNAFSWVLYGKTLAGLHTGDIKPRGTKLTPRVVLTFARKLPGKKERVFQLERIGKTNGLKLNGKHIAQDAVLSALPISWENFQHTLILGQGRPLFFDLKAQGKMQVFSDLLGLEKWHSLSSRARKITNDHIAEAAGDVRAMEQTARILNNVKERFAYNVNKSQEWEADQEAVARERSRKQHDIKKALEKSQTDFDEADAKYDFAAMELKAVRKQLTEKRGKLVTLERESAKHSLNTDAVIKEIARENASLKVKGDSCPTCGASLKGTGLERHQKLVRTKVRKLKKRKEELIVIENRAAKALASGEKEVDALAKSEQKFLDDTVQFSDARMTASRQVQDLTKELAKYKRPADEDAPRNPYEEAVRQLRTQKNELVSEWRASKDHRDMVLKKADLAKYWIDGFKQIRLYLIDETLQEISAVCETLLADVGLAGWRIKFAIERETKKGTTEGLNVLIHDPDTDAAVKWDSWSGGEAQRLRLVGSVALAQVLLRRASVEVDFLVLDEPTRGLSSEGIEDTVDFLHDHAADGRQIFYVDHHTVESTRFASVLKVHRKKAGVRIISEN